MADKSEFVAKVLNLCCRWPPQAAPATQLMMFMVFTWSLASHLACPSSEEGTLADAGVPNREMSEDDLEDAMPMEPLWDLLLPLAGFTIRDLGIQLTLGLSLAEPLLMLAVPHTEDMLRSFHERLLAWHLGGLFGQPMLVAQVVAARGECKGGSRPAAQKAAATAAAFGALVGAYACGALTGATFRRLVEEACLAFAASRRARSLLLTFGVLLAVTANFSLTVLCKSYFEEEAEAHGEVQDPKGWVQTALVWLKEHATRALQAPLRCLGPITARSLVLFGLTTVIGISPLPPLDILHFTPLRHGFSVLWFDIAGVLTSAVVVPWVLTGGVRMRTALDGTFCMAIAFCGASAFAAFSYDVMAFQYTMMAGIVLSGCSALVGAVLCAEMVAGEKGDEGVALGWTIMIGGIFQVMGSKCGEALYLRFGWLGVSSAAFVACAAAWWVARLSVGDAGAKVGEQAPLLQPHVPDEGRLGAAGLMPGYGAAPGRRLPPVREDDSEASEAA